MAESGPPVRSALCRQFARETKERILSEKKWVEDQIEEQPNFEEFIIASGGVSYTLKIKYALHLTLIDGKVLAVITGTKSYQTCPLCGLKPKSKQGRNNQVCVFSQFGVL